MGWTVGPDRFMMGNRGWMPRWRFQPAEKLEDAFRLLEEAAPQEYSICGDDKGKHPRPGPNRGHYGRSARNLQAPRHHLRDSARRRN